MSIKYKGTNVAGTTNVIANPVLAGTEANLTSLEVGGTKYKVEGGGISEITENTDTNLTGLLKGNGSKVSAETRYVPTVEVTQAQYAALVSGGTVDPDVMYVITDDNAYPATQSDLASIQATGSTNGTGATISNGTYFYLNNVLVQAKADIASGASFVLNTNYSVVTAGALNNLKSALDTSRETRLEVLGSAGLTSDGTMTINKSKYRVVWITYWQGNATRTCVQYPINFLGGASGFGADFMYVSQRSYFIINSYNTTTQVASYSCASGTSGGSFTIWGELK